MGVLWRILLLPDFRYDLPLEPGLDETRSARMVSFKGAHFPQDIMLMGVRCSRSQNATCQPTTRPASA